MFCQVGLFIKTILGLYRSTNPPVFDFFFFSHVFGFDVISISLNVRLLLASRI